MPDKFPELLTRYVGANASHRSFSVALANVKALTYILANGDSEVLGSFLAQCETTKKASPDGRYAIGMGGRATSTTMQLAVHIASNEIDLISSETGGFLAQALGLIYREVYRAFETYLVALFEEIALRDKRILFSDKQITHEDALRSDSPETLQALIIERRKLELTRGGLKGLEKAFETFSLPVVPMLEPPPIAEQQSVLFRLRTASAVRNLIEHNGGVVNSEFLKLIPDTPYKLGQRVVVSMPELGDAFSAVEWAADNLNHRAVEKFELA